VVAYSASSKKKLHAIHDAIMRFTILRSPTLKQASSFDAVKMSMLSTCGEAHNRRLHLLLWGAHTSKARLQAGCISWPEVAAGRALQRQTCTAAAGLGAHAHAGTTHRCCCGGHLLRVDTVHKRLRHG